MKTKTYITFLKSIALFAIALNIIFAYTTYSQREVIDEMHKTNKELASHIQVINTKQLNENRIAREIQNRSRVSEAWAKYLAPMYIRAAKAHSKDGITIDPLVLVRMGDAESNFKQYAISDMGARGIQQIMPKYWANGEISFVKSARDLYDPEINIQASAYILAHYIRRGGDLKAGVRGYHGGDKAFKRPKPVTIQYQRDVLKGYRGVV